jgi:hypothetical protein
LVNESVLATGSLPQATVTFAGAVIVGNAAGRTVIVLEVVIVIPVQGVAVQVSVTLPPQALGMVLKAEVTVPVSSQFPVNPLS